MILKKHFAKFKAPAVFATMLFCLFLFSCSNGIQRSKTATVSFYIDDATVQLLLQNSVFRAADDDTTETTTPSAVTPADDTDATDDTDEEEAAAEAATKETLSKYEGYYIDVTLVAETTQTKSQEITKDIKLDFEEIPIGAKVYATAQLYKYTDEEQKSRMMVYRGESDPIYVRERGNILTIKLATAKVTVSFESNGGSAVEAQSVRTGAAAQEPKNPVKPEDKASYSRENYAFEGWYSDPELTKPYNFSEPVTDDITLYAKWISDFVFVQGETVQNSLKEGRSLRISDLFVSDHEVSQSEYAAVAGKNPSNNKSSAAAELPVENVSWFDAIVYCNKLSIKEGLNPCYKVSGETDPSKWGGITNETAVSCSLTENGYRLPTESEWEYIAQKAKRTNTAFSKLAYYSENGENKTHKIKYKLADELCLCDLLGNVAEWCFDWYESEIGKAGATGPITGTTRVIRGGSYQTSGDQDSIMAQRDNASPTSKDPAVGFRVVRTVVNEYKIIKNTVTFEPNGGSSVEVQIVVNGKEATEPAVPTRTGYNFKGWQYQGTDFDFTTPITQDILLEAKWMPISYTVKYDKGASTDTTPMSDQTFTYDEEQLLADNTFAAPDTSYKFGGWSLTPHTNLPATIDCDFENKQSVKNLATQEGQEVTLYALWIDKDACKIFYTNIPDGVDNSANPDKFLIRNNVSLQNISRDYYNFVGWYEQGDTTQTIITGWNANEKTADVTLCAKWTAIEYDIHYENITGCTWTGGSASPAKFTVEDNPTLVTATGISKPGYTFGGWYDGWDVANHTAAGNRVYGWSAGDYTDEVTLYAKWTIVDYDLTYSNMDFASFTETEAHPDTFTVEEDITLPTLTGVSRTGYTFGGWFEGWDTANNTVSGNQIFAWQSGDITTHMTVYAKWTPITYRITYMSNNVDITSANPTFTSTFTVDDTISLSSFTLTRTGYTFGGWYSEQDSTTYNGKGEEVTGWNELTKTADVTVYAKWTIQNTDVGVDISFGVATGDIEVTPSESGNNVIFTAPPTGYTNFVWTFDGTVQTETSNVLTIDKSTLVKGVYDILLSAENTEDNKTYTWALQMPVN